MALAETAQLAVRLSLDDKLSGPLRKIQGGLGKVGITGRNVGRSLAVGTAAAGGALALAAREAVRWESAIAGVNKTIDATPAELKAIADGLRTMSLRMPTAANDLAAIAEAAGALGVAKEDILAFTETVALIGTTTNVTTDEAATALGQLQNVLGLTADDFDNFASTLVDLGNKGASTESQILEIARRSGGAAKLIGIAKEETLGWASAAANLGINQELAGTALQNLYLRAMPRFLNANKDFQKILGMTGDDIKRLFQKDASGAIELLLRQLGKLPKDQRITAVQKIFGKSSGLTRLVLGLADSVDRNLSPALNTSTTAWEKNTAAGEEYEKRLKTTQSQLDLLKNHVTNAAVTLGSELLPAVVEVGKRISEYLAKPETLAFLKRLGQSIRDLFTTENLDAVASALETSANVVKGAISAFNALPPEIKALAIGALTVNKLTGGAVGGAAEAFGKILGAGLQKIFAANVTVIGTNVIGGGGGVPTPAVGGGSTGVLKDALKLIIPVAVAAAAGEIVATNQAAVFNQPGADPQAIANALANKTMTFNGRVFLTNPKAITDRTDALSGTVSKVGNWITAATNAAKVAQLALLQAKGNQISAHIDTQRDRLSSLQQRLHRAKEAGDSRRAERIRERMNAVKQNIDRSNARLERIAQKKTSLRVTVPVAVTQKATVRGTELAFSQYTRMSYVRSVAS